MKQQTKSERSRRQILDAALPLFSHRGYGATSIRDIADKAGLSTGNVYHHFSDKEAIYQALFEDYWAVISDPELPFNKALATGVFPDNLEEIGRTSERFVRENRMYIALIYVDVVEFDGGHIRKFYTEMADRFEAFLKTHGQKDIEKRLRKGVSPVSALMLASRFFLNYFSVEVLFGVKDHFGKASDVVIREIADILRHGMVGNNAAAAKAVRVKPAKRTRAAAPPAPRSRSRKRSLS